MQVSTSLDMCTVAATNDTTTSNFTTMLPPEILTEIFTFYICSPSLSSSLWDESSILSSPSGDSPLLLGQICSYWRTVVLNTPTLWSSIFVECPTPDHVPLVRHWLERAGSCLLNLGFKDWFDSEGSECDEPTREVLNLFVQRKERWRSVDFVIELRDSVIFDSLDDRCGLRNLEEARVCARYWDKETSDAFWTRIHRSPALRSVDWFRAYKGFGLPMHAPWRQLRSITTLGEVSDGEILFILKACPDLLSLNVRYTTSTLMTSELPPPSSSALIQHNWLETLTLHIAADETPFFDYLSLPNLKTLHIGNECMTQEFCLEEAIGRPVEECLKRSKCTLRDLEILRFEHAPNMDKLLSRLLYHPATRDLDSFDLYPTPSHSQPFDLDILTEHPASCVRDAAVAIEDRRHQQHLVIVSPTKGRVVDLVDMDCEEYGFLEDEVKHDSIEFEFGLWLGENY